MKEGEERAGVLAPPHDNQQQEEAPPNEETPIIQLYSPYAFHCTQAIVLNEAGRRLLIDLLNRPGEIITGGPAFISDGEGADIGIIISPDEFKKPRYRSPYTADFATGGEEHRVDPVSSIDQKVALDKKEKDSGNQEII